MDRIELLKNHMAAADLTQTAVAKALGISVSAFSTWLKGNYKGDVASLDARVDDYLETVAARQALPPKQTSTVATKAFREIHLALRDIATDCELGTIVGPSGVGKTTALRAYATENRTGILIEADPTYTARAVALELCDFLNLDSRGTLHKLLGRVVEKLRGSGRLLIVDEAEHLPYRALEVIRRIHDKAGIGVALVGMPRLLKNLQGDHNHYEQLYKRVGLRYTVSSATDEDVALLVEGILGRVSDDHLTTLRRSSRRNPRVLGKLSRWCVKLCRINKCGLDENVISKAAALISIDPVSVAA